VAAAAVAIDRRRRGVGGVRTHGSPGLFLLFLLSRAAADERRPPTVTEGGRRDGAAVELLAGVRAHPVAEHAVVE